MQIRADSRVGRILTEFKGHDDWCSVTILKHSMATIIQVGLAAQSMGAAVSCWARTSDKALVSHNALETLRGAAWYGSFGPS